jgi:iron complex outermembrane receptor protein
MLPFLAVAQFYVSGRIIDQQTGETLPGATISILNTNYNTLADKQGNYIIKNVAAGNYTIKVSYIGYQFVQASISLSGNLVQNFKLAKGNLVTDEVTVHGINVGSDAPTTFTNLTKKDLAKNNFGQDLPYLLNQTPSAVITSDGGTGIGYTGIRIRGSDGTRTNVTLNGIPLNDAEDQGAYFVDLPDLVSSVDNIQIQRGVGTSTNGAGAFGASINMQTTTRRDTGYTELNNSFGSYGTIKNTVQVGSGLIDGKFSFDGRLSRITSNGYIDRATSDLKSYFASGAYYGKNTLIRLNVFSGYEKTYQAWDGVADNVITTDRTYNELGLEPNGSFYNNQTDNYTQNYGQLLINQKISDVMSFNGALFYTKGFGYYEEYKQNQSVTDYGLTPVVIGGTTISNTDLVRRLWLNNDFYGVTYNFDFHPVKAFNLNVGGAYNEYKGAHYDNIEWTQQTTTITPDYEYERDNAKKDDFNIYAKADLKAGDFTFFADLQLRLINYSFYGLLDNSGNSAQQTVTPKFFNPKGGITYHIDDNSNIYASVAIANHEPNREDYVNSTPSTRPSSEHLTDFEAGYRINTEVFKGGVNAFYMDYKNQLVLTGALDYVGGAIRVNVPSSYRAGIEADGKLNIAKSLSWQATGALSTNKIKNFEADYFNYDNNQNVSQQLNNTNIAYSPAFVGSSEVDWAPFKHAEIAFISKYVGMQYLDNTSNTNPVGFSSATVNGNASNRTLDSYFVNNLRLSYHFKMENIKNVGISFLVYNLFSTNYITNGATYPDIEGVQVGSKIVDKVINYNYYYPQAPRNYFVSLSLGF